MEPNKLVFSWKDHSGTVVSVFENLLNKNILVDCTLAAEGQYLKAHKIVLSACSSYFELLFSQESEKNPIVILKDVDFQELEAAVHFMYRGEVEVCEDRLAAFMEVAKSLQIKGLGCDARTQRSREKSSTLSEKTSSPNAAVSPWQHSRTDALNSFSDFTNESPTVPVDCEPVGNDENSAVNKSFQSESSHSSPTLPPSSFFSQSGQDSQNDENNQSSLTALPQVSLEENEQSSTKPAIKIEPVTDTCGEREFEDADMDFVDDLAKMEDEEDWDEDNGETMSDALSTSQQDFGNTSTHMKTGDVTSDYPEGMQSGNLSSLEGNTSTHMKTGDVTSDHPEGMQSGNQSSLEGAEIVIIPYDQFNQQSTGSSAPVNQSDTTSIYGVPAGSTNSSFQHENPQPPESEKRVCLACHKLLSSITKLRKHMRMHNHSGNQEFSYCDYSAQCSASLAVHLREHTDERPFKCSYCTHSCKLSSDLTRHMRIHTEEKPFQCSECDYKATQLSSLNQHRHKKHSFFHQCPECDYKAKTLCALTVHRRIHSGEKPYECPECDYKAKHSSNLYVHRRKKHRVFHQCPECDYKATDSRILTIHRRIHSGEKPYQCPECDYKTRVVSSLKAHRRKQHVKYPYQCSECDFKTNQSLILTKHRSIHSGREPRQCLGKANWRHEPPL